MMTESSSPLVSSLVVVSCDVIPAESREMSLSLSWEVFRLRSHGCICSFPVSIVRDVMCPGCDVMVVMRDPPWQFSSIMCAVSWGSSTRWGAPFIQSLWISVWRRKSQFRRKNFLQTAQLCGLRSVCVNMCVLRLLRWLNILPQVWHLWGDS